jgi:high-affinity nickel permease
VEPWLFLGLALALGVKHAYDPDHLAATSLLLARAPGARDAVRLGLHWGVGHTITAGLLTSALFLAKDQLAASWLAQMDLLVAGTLVVVGVLALVWEARLIHRHAHAHGSLVHDHAHWHVLGHRVEAHHAMLGLGLLHGIASNDELLLLLTASLGVASLGGLLAGVGVFSLGVVAGMALFAALLALPAVRARSLAVRRAVNVATALASVAVGAAMLLG